MHTKSPNYEIAREAYLRTQACEQVARRTANDAMRATKPEAREKLIADTDAAALGAEMHAGGAAGAARRSRAAGEFRAIDAQTLADDAAGIARSAERQRTRARTDLTTTQTRSPK